MRRLALSTSHAAMMMLVHGGQGYATKQSATPESPKEEEAVNAATEAPAADAEGSVPGGEEQASGTDAQVTKVEDTTALSADEIVEKFSRAAMKRQGRENQIEPIIYKEDLSYPPILGGEQNVYDYTDDIPTHVRPGNPNHFTQTREYFRAQRYAVEHPLHRRWGFWALLGSCGLVFAGALTAWQIWLHQPADIAQMRYDILQYSYGRVLELAAGDGGSVGSYPYPAYEIHLTDSSHLQLSKLQYRLPKAAYPKYVVEKVDATRLEQYEDASFDTVIDTFGLCHYRDPIMALRQMQRVCKPSGQILLLEHGRSRYPPVNSFLDTYRKRHEVNTHGCQWNLPMEDYFKEARLVVREYKRKHFGTTHYVVAHPEILADDAKDAIRPVEEIS